MSEFTRVRDNVTGHEYSVRFPNDDQHTVLEDEDAVDSRGEPLPAKPFIEDETEQPDVDDTDLERASTVDPTIPPVEVPPAKPKTTAAIKGAAKTPDGDEPVKFPEEGPK